jgi:hypothetical protein
MPNELPPLAAEQTKGLDQSRLEITLGFMQP